MDITAMPIAQLVATITVIGVLSGAFFKVFSIITDVKYNKESIKN